MSLHVSAMFPGVAHIWEDGLMLYERETLCGLADLPLGHAVKPWDAMSSEECAALLFAFRRAQALGASCAAALLHDSELQNAPRFKPVSRR